ncbi:MAG: pYEATS domain-containing protein [Pseudomonadota bacterium]|nr:pYEATS domain-containing protein [Pseudomonadota bacterium]
MTVLVVALLLIWQIAQIVISGTVGIPGIFTIGAPLVATARRPPQPSADTRPGGVTTIHRRIPGPQEKSAMAPQAGPPAPSPPPIVAPPPQLPAPEQAPAPKAPERAAPSPLVLTRPQTTPAPTPAPEPKPKVAAIPPAPAEPIELPSRSDVEGWIRSQAREFVGGVDKDGLPLYRFDVWLEAPANVNARIQSVTYEYFAPSAQPPNQVGDDRASGFRVKFAGAACAEKLVVKVTLDDGRERKVEVDGCSVLN